MRARYAVPKAGVDRADLRPDLPELRLVGRDGQIAQHCQHVAAADGKALHAGDDGLRHVADDGVQLLHG